MKDRIFLKVIEFLQENKLYKKKLDNMFVFTARIIVEEKSLYL